MPASLPRRLALLLLLAAGCGAPPARASAPEGAGTRVRITMPRGGALRRYACTRTLTFAEPGSTPLEAAGQLAVRARPGGRWIRQWTYLRADGPGRRLAGVQLRSLVDARHRTLEGPARAAGRPNLLALGGQLVDRVLAPYLPPGPVAPGARWAEPTFTWGERPFPPDAIAVDRRFRLASVSAGRATVAWEVELRVSELALQGLTVSGRASVSGTRSFPLDDPLAGRAVLDIAIDGAPDGVQAMLGQLHFETKLRERCERLPARAPGPLAQPLRPEGERPAGDAGAE